MPGILGDAGSVDLSAIEADITQLETDVAAAQADADSAGTAAAAAQSDIDGAKYTYTYGIYSVSNAAANQARTEINPTSNSNNPVVPFAGHLIGYTLNELASGPVTAGSITVGWGVDGADQGATYDTTITSSDGECEYKALGTALAVAAGDRLTMFWSSSAGLLPAGSMDFAIRPILRAAVILS